MSRSFPRSPTQAHPSDSVFVSISLAAGTHSGMQQDTSSRNILSLLGLERALKKSAISSICLSRIFDIYRNIDSQSRLVKFFYTLRRRLCPLFLVYQSFVSIIMTLLLPLPSCLLPALKRDPIDSSLLHRVL